MSTLTGIELLGLISGGASDSNIRNSTVDPSAGGGVAAAEGSLLLRFVAAGGELWLKTGVAATAWTQLIAGGTTAILTFGADSIAAAADKRFLPPGFIDGTATTASEAAFRAPRAGTLQNFRVRHNVANGNGNAVVYDIDINGVPSGLGISLVSGAIGDASDLATTIAVAAGDLIEATATKAASIGSGNQDSIVAMELSA